MNLQFDTNILIGLSETDARELAKSNGFFGFRVTRKDKVSYIVTCDFRPYRINVAIDNDKVSKVYFG
jgi:hypothetical protein